MVGFIPPTQRKQYIPPNQRPIIGVRDCIHRLRHLWSKRTLLTQSLSRVRQTLPALTRTLGQLLPSKNDPALKATIAWQELHAANAALKATTDSCRRDFGDPVQLKSMQTNLQSSGNRPTTVGNDVHVCKLLQTFLAHQPELTAKLTAVNAAATAASERSRRLVRLYEQSAKHHGPQSTWHAGYLQFAADCHREADSAVDLAQKTATRQVRLNLLMGEAAAIVRFFSELKLHQDRSSALNPNPSAYRLQLAQAVSLCLQAVEALEP